MMAQSCQKFFGNYVKLINQFPLDIIRLIRKLERINKKYVDQNIYNI